MRVVFQNSTQCAQSVPLLLKQLLRLDDGVDEEGEVCDGTWCPLGEERRWACSHCAHCSVTDLFNVRLYP